MFTHHVSEHAAQLAAASHTRRSKAP
jgi:hypothetical protein